MEKEKKIIDYFTEKKRDLLIIPLEYDFNEEDIKQKIKNIHFYSSDDFTIDIFENTQDGYKVIYIDDMNKNKIIEDDNNN